MKIKRIITILFLFCLWITAYAQDLTFATVENQYLMEICSNILEEVYSRLDISIIPMTALISRNMYHFVHESHEDLIPLIEGTIRGMILSGEMEELIHDIESKLLDID